MLSITAALWALAALPAVATGAPVLVAATPPRGRFVFASTDRLTFTQASELCQSKGATLPVINNANDQQELVAFIAADPALSGLGTSVITYLNARRQGTCNGAATSPECAYAMVQADGTSVTVYRGEAPEPDKYTNWGGGFPVPLVSWIAVGVRRDGRWVNLSPTEPDTLPYATVCEVRAVAGHEVAWWMAMMPLLVMAGVIATLVVAVMVGWCLRWRMVKLLPPPPPPSPPPPPVATGEAATDGCVSELDDAGTQTKSLVMSRRSGRRSVGSLGEWADIPPPVSYCRYPKESSGSLAPGKHRGVVLKREYEELYLLLEHVPEYVEGDTAAVNPLLLLVDHGTYCGELSPMYPIELLYRTCQIRQHYDTLEAPAITWDFQALVDPNADFQRLQYRTLEERVEHIRRRLPPFVVGMPPYLSARFLDDAVMTVEIIDDDDRQATADETMDDGEWTVLSSSRGDDGSSRGSAM